MRKTLNFLQINYNKLYLLHFFAEYSILLNNIFILFSTDEIRYGGTQQFP